jgi:two-component system chemotaxis response regulator CheY
MKQVLIVDDSDTTRNFHAYILKNAGYDTDVAVDGSEALEKVFGGNFDLVITDINMPLMDGLTLIERVRADANFEELPIIVVSTEEEDEDKQRGLEAGANVYIVKPTDPEQLIENVKLLVD